MRSQYIMYGKRRIHVIDVFLGCRIKVNEKSASVIRKEHGVKLR